jgi:orotate phosphoribosyltransferase
MLLKSEVSQEMETTRDRLLTILRLEAYARKDVILSSGKPSHYYIDCRQVTLAAEGAFLTAKLILADLAEHHIQAIGGLTMGADPIVAAVAALSFADQQPVQAFIVRKEAKKHGRRRSIEGPALPPGARVAVVDDVATTGGSILKAIERVRDETDWQVARVLCLVDRQEGARELLAEAGFDLISLFTGEELGGR